MCLPSRFLRSLLLGLCLWLPLPAALAAPVAGTDYVEIEGGAPFQPQPGTLEVAEVFAYWCGHCAAMQPKLEAWKRTLPRDVRVTYVPLPGGRDDMLARGFFVAERLGALPRVHAATYRAIHEQQSLPRNPTADEMAAFYAGFGLDAAKVRAALLDPALADQLARARRFAIESGVEGTPTLVVAGRYRVLGRTLDDSLRIAGELVAMLRTRR
ncbi:thiol:disulfide interchange protein DsbA/DsbL [Vulcaniibacterium gelatinicum]|uniref:thiol:disulfide interchange protein DsbA/DsbL n=1 Tax=Vulcaniibacterium gelatinicum TaxID=2598725 RepID=UPI0011CC3E6A|nr:thiol:disulfide interchange protein DsbA/DsbL [Vulcaniibacterium gelatinicum]